MPSHAPQGAKGQALGGRASRRVVRARRPHPKARHPQGIPKVPCFPKSGAVPNGAVCEVELPCEAKQVAEVGAFKDEGAVFFGGEAVGLEAAFHGF